MKKILITIALLSVLLSADNNDTVILDIQQYVSIEFKDGSVKKAFFTRAGQLFVYQDVNIVMCIDQNDANFSKSVENIMFIDEDSIDGV